MTNNTIELSNVSRSYKLDKTDLCVLNKVNMVVKRGECVAIMGPSGSGKSTMLHLVGCLDKPSSGTVKIDGKDVSKLDDNALADIRAEKIGFVFQFFYLIPSLNALRNVMMPMTFTGKISKDKQEERATELLKRVGLDHRIYHMPSQLSGGERQRVAVARAMANDPEIILADEPTGNLDSKSGKEILGMLLKLNEEGTTVVLITHDQNVANHAERTVYIKDGQVVKKLTK
jgi:putative ABC transport system ATP-binding protein